MFLLLALLSASSATGPRCGLVDVGRADDGTGPLAVLVETPGFAPSAFRHYVASLEGSGVDVLALRLPVSCHDPALLVERVLPRTLARHPRRPTAVLAHAWTGSLVVETVSSLPPDHRPAALALIGTPLRWEPRTLWSTLLVPGGGGAPTWLDGRPPDAPPSAARALLLGATEVPLAPLGEPFTAAIRTWLSEGYTTSTRALSLPVHAVAASLDRLAPVETVRPLLGPEQRFTRHGRASMLGAETDHAFLLRDPKPAAALSAWVAETLQQAP